MSSYGSIAESDRKNLVLNSLRNTNRLAAESDAIGNLGHICIKLLFKYVV